MNRSIRGLVSFVIVFHIAVFVAEALLWMNPAVHGRVLRLLGDGSAIDPLTQAALLQRLFVNQGFYNLFLAATGIAALWRQARGDAAVARALLLAMCLWATAAGVVLAASTGAYIGALLQAGPAAAAALLLLRSSGR